MTVLRWLGGLVLLIWLVALIFRIGNSLINTLIIIAAIIFIIDALYSKRKSI
ncbi:hypothetical protein [Clostridium sp. JNZ J1-5]